MKVGIISIVEQKVLPFLVLTVDVAKILDIFSIAVKISAIEIDSIFSSPKKD
jgi:hypothetical protein